MDRRAVVGGAADDGEAAADLEPGRVGRGHAGGRVDVRTAGERLTHPDAELVAVGVGEPPHLFAVRGQRAVAGPVRPVGHLAAFAGGAVPGVQLEGAGGVADVEAPVGGVRRPVGQRDPGGPQALLPDGDGGFGHTAP